MRRLYQLGNSLIEEIGFINNVNPEQKRNKTSPIVPPVANTLYFPYSNPICEFVIKRTAKNFRISIPIFLSFIPVSMSARHPESDSFNYYWLQNKSGVSGFYLFCNSRPSTALVENKQSDTHAVDMNSTPLKVCVKAWLAIGTPTGTVYTYPQQPLLYCSRQLIRFVEVSNCQKQSVSNAFHNVVLPPYSRSNLLEGGSTWVSKCKGTNSFTTLIANLSRIANIMQNYGKNPKTARTETKFNNNKKWRNHLDYTTSLWYSYCCLLNLTLPPRKRL